MFQPLLQRVSLVGAIAVALMLSALFCLPQTTLAAPAVSLDPSSPVVNTAAIYKFDKADQPEVLSQIVQLNKEMLPQSEGFLDAAVLSGQDENQIVVLSQWQGLPFIENYTQQQSQNAPKADQLFACQVQHVESRTADANFTEGDVVMFSQFKIKPGKNQDELAAIIPQMMPGALQAVPGLQWGAMCPSTNKSTISLIARWKSRDDFLSLGQEPGYDKSTNYWQDYANNEHGLYDVVQVIR